MANFLFINTLYYPNIKGGAEIILQTQAEQLVQMGHTVSVLTTTDKTGLRFEYIHGVKVYRAKLKNIYWHYDVKKPSKIKRLLWHLRDVYNNQMKSYVRSVLHLEKPDVVFCHNLAGWSASVYDVLSSENVLFVQVLHDQYWVCPNSNKFAGGAICEKQCFTCSILRYPHHRISSKASAVIGVSEFVLNSLIKERYFEGVPNFVIHNARKVLPIQKDLTRKKSLQIGFIGAVSPVKGVELLIKAFCKLSNNNIELLIAGSGDIEYVKYLTDQYPDERISYLGYVNSMEFYKNIDVLVVPSLWPDTFPGVVFEALASNIPVIGASIGGIPEMIIDGYNGLLFDAGSSSSLIEKICCVIENRKLMEMMSGQSRDSISQLLSVSRMIEDYLDVCKQIGVELD